MYQICHMNKKKNSVYALIKAKGIPSLHTAGSNIWGWSMGDNTPRQNVEDQAVCNGTQNDRNIIKRSEYSRMAKGTNGGCRHLS